MTWSGSQQNLNRQRMSFCCEPLDSCYRDMRSRFWDFSRKRGVQESAKRDSATPHTTLTSATQPAPRALHRSPCSCWSVAARCTIHTAPDATDQSVPQSPSGCFHRRLQRLSLAGLGHVQSHRRLNAAIDHITVQSSPELVLCDGLAHRGPPAWLPSCRLQTPRRRPLHS